MSNNVIDILKERGFIEAMTHEELRDLSKQPLKVYCGFDPTSDSLHLGNMVAIMGLAWFQRFGHTPVAIVGGATGMIGDPSGKSTERQLLSQKIIENNLQGIRRNLEAILAKPGLSAPIILNNYDWFQQFTLIDFLRDIGKFFRLGPMLSKDSVKSRFESEEGMSFTEFSYQLLQGYDFLHLYQQYGVTVQLGGSDQWGNITAGIELIKKVAEATAYGVTFPLMVRSDGQKFGKSERGAIWLSPEKLSPYEFYQYLFRIADTDVIKLMKLLTFMEMKEIREYELTMQQADYIPNTAQRKLAEEVTKIVHGDSGLRLAQDATEKAAPGAETALDPEKLEVLMQEMPSQTLPRQSVIECKLIDLLVLLSLQPSKGEARRLIRNGGLYLNNQQVKDEGLALNLDHLIGGKFILLAVGKKHKLLVKIA